MKEGVTIEHPLTSPLPQGERILSIKKRSESIGAYFD
jgi:hypothetical protein